jgi:predicted MPP superfamily phosphohydrolase
MIRLVIYISLLCLNFSTRQPVVDSNSIDSETQKPIISFGIVSDIQYCNCESDGTRFYSESLTKLRGAINDLNRHNLQFIVNLGDLIDRDITSLDSLLPIIGESNFPVYHVLGNHDFTDNIERGESINSLLNTGPGYYSFAVENFRFIVLNSSDISTYSPSYRSRKQATKLLESLTSDQVINAYEWNGTLGSKQIEWLVNQLDQAENIGEKVILLSHHPVWPESRHCMFEYDKILKLIANYNNIGAWFSGHNHSGAYGNLNLVHFVTFRGMVETEDLNSYSVIELYNNKIWIKGYGREKSQILAW